MTFKEQLTDSIRYWEPRRLIYNGALGLVVVGTFITSPPGAKQQLNIGLALFVFVLAVLANVAYCAAYVADLFAQSSEFRELWLRFRWLVLAVGIAFGGTLTWFFASGLFAPR